MLFHYHHQIDKSIKEIKSLKNLIYVHAKFVILRLPKENFRNFKKYGGGCLLDMGSYAAAVFRIFINQNYKKANFYISSKKDKKDLSTDFNIYIRAGKKTFFGYFSHNGEYENT